MYGVTIMSLPGGLLTAHLEKLPYFVEVAASGSFRKASERLRIAQPSLSKAIAVLETACGARLFERRRQGTRLTPEGERLLETAREILRAAARYASGPVAGEAPRQLGFVTHELLLPSLAPGLAAAADKGVSLEIKTAPSVTRLLSWITDYEADAGVIASPEPRPGLCVAPLFEDRYGLLCSAGFAKRYLSEQSKPLTLTELRALPLIMAPQVLAGTNETLAERLKRMALGLEPKHVVGSLESVAALTGEGF
jgi:LysR family hydrogen peroxide-inducible transcriptional activator